MTPKRRCRAPTDASADMTVRRSLPSAMRSNNDMDIAIEFGFKWGTGHGTYSQYSYPICSRLEAESDVISGVAVEEVGLDGTVKFVDSKSKRF